MECRECEAMATDLQTLKKRGSRVGDFIFYLKNGDLVAGSIDEVGCGSVAVCITVDSFQRTIRRIPFREIHYFEYSVINTL